MLKQQGLGEMMTLEPNDRLDDDGRDVPTARTFEESQSLRDKVLQGKHVGRIQKMAQTWVASAFTEFMIMFLVLLDLTLTLYEASLPTEKASDLVNHWQNPFMVLTGAILFVYTYEGMVRIIGFQWSLLNGTRILDTADVAVVVASIGVFFYTISQPGTSSMRAITFARVIRFTRILKFANRARKWMGLNRRRFKKDGFDLDLTYITPSVIAMSLPSVGAEAAYRNPIEDVVRFFETFHKDRYLIFNLCKERSYDTELFQGRVERICVEDHNPPLFEQLCSFVQRAEVFKNESPYNVMAVHCKGGKGRTGVFVCTWLLYSQFSSNSHDAQAHFAQRRTGELAKKVQNVGGASQIRYINYFEKALASGGYRTNKIKLLKVRMHTCPHMDSDGGCDPWISIEQSYRQVFSSRDPPKDTSAGPSYKAKARQRTLSAKDRSSSTGSRRTMEVIPPNMKKDDEFFDFEMDLELSGDVRVFVYDYDNMPPRNELVCFLWFHTGFIFNDVTVFEKSAIDIAW